MKRVIISFLCLATLLTAFIVPFTVSATDTWEDVGDYWECGIARDFDDLTGMWHKISGNFTNAVIPSNAQSFAQMYYNMNKGYVYTFTQYYNVSIQPGGLTDTIQENCIPIFVTCDYPTLMTTSGTTTTFPVDTYKSNGDYADSASIDAKGKFRCTGFLSWRNQRATIRFVVEPLEDYYFADKAFGIGIKFFDGLKEQIGSVVLSGMDIKATKAVTSDTYYQEQLQAMDELKTEVANQGGLVISSIDQNGEQTRQTIDQAKTDITNEIKNQPSNEHQYAEQNKGDTSEIDNLIPEIPIDGTKSFISDVFTTLSTTETKTTMTIPDGNIPFFAGFKLWESQTIDFTPWLNNPHIKALIAWWKGIFSLGVVFAIIWNVYSLVLVALGLKRPSSPENDMSNTIGIDSDSDYERMKKRGLK